MEQRCWEITNLILENRGGVFRWCFKGTKAELDSYLNEHHSCHLPCCEGVDWWHSVRRWDYEVVEINNRGIDG